MNQQRLVQILRRITWALAALGVVYLLVRFDTLPVPEGRSPIYRYGPGDRLLVDLRYDELVPEDAVVVRGEQGGLHLCLVERQDPDQGVWVRADHEDAFASEQVGWIRREDVLGRIVLALPW